MDKVIRTMLHHATPVLMHCFAALLLLAGPAMAEDDIQTILAQLQQQDEAAFSAIGAEISTTIERREEGEWRPLHLYEARLFLDSRRYDFGRIRYDDEDGSLVPSYDNRVMWGGTRYLIRQQSKHQSEVLARFSAENPYDKEFVPPHWGGGLRGAVPTDPTRAVACLQIQSMSVLL